MLGIRCACTPRLAAVRSATGRRSVAAMALGTGDILGTQEQFPSVVPLPQGVQGQLSFDANQLRRCSQ